jgi:hypothetical protein
MAAYKIVIQVLDSQDYGDVVLAQETTTTFADAEGALRRLHKFVGLTDVPRENQGCCVVDDAVVNF